jgi:uridine kinase
LINYQELLSNLRKIETTSPRVFAIDGVAGSGKTTLASQLQLDLPGSQVVHMDDLYSGWKDPLSQDLIRRVCDEILNPFLMGHEVIYRKFNKITSLKDWALMKEELKDRFGKTPQEIEDLEHIIILREVCIQNKIKILILPTLP